MHPLIDSPPLKFENRFAELYGASYAVSTASGTSAYLAALLALDLPKGCEIIVPVYTWPQLVAAPRALGYRVRFVDCQPDCSVAPEAIRGAISKHTGAIVICHLFGSPVDSRGISGVAAEHGLPLLEDCSQALFARQLGRYVGNWGAVGFSSLGCGKLLSAGEGGVAWTCDSRLYLRLVEFTQHPDRWEDQRKACNTLWKSLSLRMHPHAAELALRDLRGISERIERLCLNHEKFRVLIREVVGIEPLKARPDSAPVWQHCPLQVRPDLVDKLMRFWWDRQPAYLMSDRRAFRTGRMIERTLRFIQTGRTWADVRSTDVERLASDLRAAAEQ